MLTDTTGLHLGAGPYMLIYSREAEEVDVKRLWPTRFRASLFCFTDSLRALTDSVQNNVKTENFDFLDQLVQTDIPGFWEMREAYNPSPIIAPTSMLEDEALSNVQRRSMSAMSVVEEEPEDEETWSGGTIVGWHTGTLRESNVRYKSDSSDLKATMSAMSVVDEVPGPKTEVMEEE